MGLDARFLSGLKDERVKASAFYAELGLGEPKPLGKVDKAQLMTDVRQALFASKICSYAQGMNIIKAKSLEQEWDIPMGELAGSGRAGASSGPGSWTRSSRPTRPTRSSRTC